MATSSIVNVEGLDGKPAEAEATPTGWFYRTAAGLKGLVRGFRDGLVCRVAPGADRDVVQLGVGAATSRLSNALYSPRTDTALVFKADGLAITPIRKGKGLKGFEVATTGPLTVTVLRDYLKVHRGLPWFKPLDKKHFPRPPAGWCSWYYYYLDITEAEVVKNTDWLADNLKKFGCEWVQIDDGWQGRGTGYGTNRDWFVTCEKDFPRGMKWSADYIRSRGFRPGIWCIPFTESNPEMYAKQPGLFVRKPDGTSPGEREHPLPYDWMKPEAERFFDWPGRYYIDATGAEGQAHFKRLFEMICNEWGYDYVKIDAQGMMADFYDTWRTRLADPSFAGDRAYRAGLDAAKAVMGPERFLLNCGAGWSSVGYCEGVRIGGDVDARAGIKGMIPAISSTMQWLWLNTLAFYTDPDVVCVREPLTMDLARVWVTLVGITGQLLMASDKMDVLPEDRVELLRRIFPVADIHPMELYPLSDRDLPSIFDLKVATPRAGSWDVVALFNWSDTEARKFDLMPAKLGLEEGNWIVLDVWAGKLLAAGTSAVSVDVAPGSTRVVGIWRDEGRPQVVGTSRHLTQGAVDLESVQWDSARSRLSGNSEVVGGDPYRLRLYVPDGWRVVTKNVRQDGRLAELVIERRESAKVFWRVDFAKA